jgi:hypothetical protein
VIAHPPLAEQQDERLALAGGGKPPDEAEALTATISTFIKSVEIAELEQRLAELEAWRTESKAATANHYNA